MTGPLITLLSDFGTQDAYVGTMKGIMLGICPSATLVDLTHDVPRHDIRAGALLLRGAVDYFPRTAVHLAVVDPGVGSSRAPILIVTERGILVGPDNGLLVPAAERLGRHEARRLEAPEFFRPAVSRTFHGRDVFAPVAAHLAAGIAAHRFGPIQERPCALNLPEPRVEDDCLTGEVIYVDHFGNLMTNIMAEAIAALGPSVSVEIVAGTMIPLAESYAAVDVGQPLAIISSWGALEIAIREGHAADFLAAGSGTPVVVRVLTERR